MYRPKPIFMLVYVSGASKMEKMQVFSGALGLGMLRIWKHNLNEPPPLYPPNFNHTSSSGMAPPCQVTRCTLLRVAHSKGSFCVALYYHRCSGL